MLITIHKVKSMRQRRVVVINESSFAIQEYFSNNNLIHIKILSQMIDKLINFKADCQCQV